MPTYVAFLRAINLGPTRKFPKGDIAAATEAAGFTDVATHINTGNVRLSTSMRSRPRIEAALEAAYLADRGFEVPTVVLGADEVCTVVADADELAEAYAGRFTAQYVSLLKEEPGAEAVAAFEALSGEAARAVVRDRAVHLLVTGAYHQAALTNASVEKQLGPATNRNLTVLRAVADKWCR